MDHANETLQHEVWSKARSYRLKNIEGGRFDDNTNADKCMLVNVLRVIINHA